MTEGLTIREREAARAQALDTMRKRLEERRPDAAQYTTSGGRDGEIIAATLTYAKAAVPIMAVLAALASAVRTIQVVSTIYYAAGSSPIGVGIAALAFTLAAEGALFVLALAQAGEHMRRRSERRERHVVSLATVWRAFLVRIGRKAPLRHDELPESSGGIAIVIALALIFTLSTNLYLGLKPLIDQLGATSLQNFIGSLWTAPAALQMTFVVDLSAALFAPLVAFAAGHLTARFAAEIAERGQSARTAYESDLHHWREAYANPLATDEGRELLNEYLDLKLSSKAARSKKREPLPFGHTAHAADESGYMSMNGRVNGHGGEPTAQN